VRLSGGDHRLAGKEVGRVQRGRGDTHLCGGDAAAQYVGGRLSCSGATMEGDSASAAAHHPRGHAEEWPVRRGSLHSWQLSLCSNTIVGVFLISNG
jgi:hypothetical protein